MSRSTALGDAVVASLNGESFSEAFTSTRKFRPINSLKDLSDLTVTILVPSLVQSMISRSANSDNIQVSVLIQQQADPDNNTVMDALIDLCEEISDFLRSVDFSYANWNGTEITTLYDMEDAADFRVFSGMITLTYIYHWRK